MKLSARTPLLVLPLLLPLAGALGLAGCSEETQRKTGQAFEVFAQDLTEAAESGREDLEAVLGETSEALARRIEDLERRARESGLDEKLDAVVVDLRAKKEQLDQRLDQLEAASEAGWKELKAGAVKAAEEARRAWHEAAPPEETSSQGH